MPPAAPRYIKLEISGTNEETDYLLEWCGNPTPGSWKPAVPAEVFPGAVGTTGRTDMGNIDRDLSLLERIFYRVSPVP